MRRDHLLAQARSALNAGDIQTAISLLQAVADAPDASGADFLELADALWTDFRFTEALDAFERAARADPTNPVPLLLAAKRCFSLGRFGDSARLLGLALERRPDDASTRRMLAEVLDREGRRSEAEVLARDALRQSPKDARAARALAHIMRAGGRTPEAADLLRRQIADQAGPEVWRLHHELAHCLDRLGDYAGAMEALLAAKAGLRGIALPLLEQWEHRARRREEFARALDRTTLQRWRDARLRLRSPCPITILAGHPRSGTTLLEQMLAAHPRIITTDETGILRMQFIEPIVLAAPSTADAVKELNEFDISQLAAGREFYFRATEAHLGEPIGTRLLIEKDPLATYDLGFMLRLLPECRVIFPLRDPRDVCVSFFFTLLPLNADSAPSLDLGSTCAAAALTLKLWLHWRQVMAQPWIETRYERLVENPRTELARITGALDVPWDEHMLSQHEQRRSRGVRTPTYADVAQPVYTRSIGRWRHYAQWLEPHLGSLASLLAEFQYE